MWMMPGRLGTDFNALECFNMDLLMRSIIWFKMSPLAVLLEPPSH